MKELKKKKYEKALEDLYADLVNLQTDKLIIAFVVTPWPTGVGRTSV